jgi:outer membrane protein assembly factor BamA
VDATANPDFQIEENRDTVDVIVKIDEQIQYRVGSIEMLGVNALTQEKLMESIPKSGQVFDGTWLWDLFQSESGDLALRCVSR